jgi:hypothetical protein
MWTLLLNYNQICSTKKFSYAFIFNNRVKYEYAELMT